MKKLICIFILVISFTSLASDLADYCQSDPRGEIYSEVIDSDVCDGFESIGLNANDYKQLISQNPTLDLMNLSDKAKVSHPEIANAL
jgi:hypothetical protein